MDISHYYSGMAIKQIYNEGIYIFKIVYNNSNIIAEIQGGIDDGEGIITSVTSDSNFRGKGLAIFLIVRLVSLFYNSKGINVIKLDDTSDRFGMKRNIYLSLGFTYDFIGEPEMTGDAKTIIERGRNLFIQKLLQSLNLRQLRDILNCLNSPINMIERFKSEGIGYLETITEEQLNSMLTELNNAYYGSGVSLLTDNRYDMIREFTLEKYPQNKIARGGHRNYDKIKGAKNKAKLPYFMGSLDKIKPDKKVMDRWVSKYSGPYVLSCKLDGVSGLYTTENNAQKLYTRGNGEIGLDISYLIPHLKLPNVSNLAIRGEFIISKDKFMKKYKPRGYKNGRNFVAGIINSKTVNIESIQDIDFVAYEVIKPFRQTPLEQFEILNALNIDVVEYKETKLINIDILSEYLRGRRQQYKYEIDGIICVDNKVYNRKKGNPEHMFAFKMVMGEQIAETRVTNVVWNPSKDGYLKPTIEIEPVILGGVTITKATGFNAKFISDKKIGVGAVVSIIRSGDVIPHIQDVTTEAPEPLMPSVPYVWNDSGVDIELKNKDQNSIVKQKIILDFFKKLGIQGVGPGNTKKIIDAGYNSIPAVVFMTEVELKQIFGDKTAKNIYKGIRDQLGKVSLPTLMDASNIFGRGFGETKFEAILSKHPDILTNSENRFDKVNSVEGMGDISSNRFVEKIGEFVDFVREIGMETLLTKQKRRGGEQKRRGGEQKRRGGGKLSGQTIVFTGFRDKNLENKIKKEGGKIGNSITKKTTLLVIAEGTKKSGKIKKAEEKGIPIITKDEFINKYT